MPSLEPPFANLTHSLLLLPLSSLTQLCITARSSTAMKLRPRGGQLIWEPPGRTNRDIVFHCICNLLRNVLWIIPSIAVYICSPSVALHRRLERVGPPPQMYSNLLCARLRLHATLLRSLEDPSAIKPVGQG